MLRNLTVTVLLAGACLLGNTTQAASANAGKDINTELRDLANLIHNRIVGVPAQGKTLTEMVDLLATGKAREAAMLATEHPFFYDYKLRAMFTPWSNRESAVSAPLNDMVLTMIGMVRDDVPFNQVLSSDFYYDIGTSADIATQGGQNQAMKPNKEELRESLLGEVRSPAKQQVYLSLKDILLQYKQAERVQRIQTIDDLGGTPSDNSIVLPDAGISGVLSTKGFGQAFYTAGTNRRATAFVLKNFLCHEIEQLHDKQTPAHWVRQDVNRTPGGDSEIFKNRCVGCHAGMDALSGWSVYYNYGEVLVWTDSQVQNKVFKNNLFTDPNKDEGRNYSLDKNRNDNFTNLWTEGKNAALGWRGKTSGKGAKEFGEMMTRSKAFSSCMVRHVYQAVCYLDPKQNSTAKAKHEQLAKQFEQDDYNMRNLFAATAVACLTKPTEEQNASSGE